MRKRKYKKEEQWKDRMNDRQIETQGDKKIDQQEEKTKRCKDKQIHRK